MMITWCFVWILLAAVVQPEEWRTWLPKYATQFYVEYGPEEKLVVNVYENTTYCLYEAETPPIGCNKNGNYTPVRTPLKYAFVMPTPVIPLFEYLGERGNIKSVLDASEISSTCVLEMINNNMIGVDGYFSEDTGVMCVNTTTFDERNIGAAFTTVPAQNESCGSGTKYANTTILFSDFAEDFREEDLIVLAMAEWIYYVACFYNKEALAEKFLKNLFGKWDCLTTNLNECNKWLFVNRVHEVAFLPLYYNGTWKRPDPNTYYAQIIRTIKAEMVTCNGTGNSNDFSSVMSTKELAECISTTDVCIFQTNFSSLPLEDQQILSEAKCIKEHAYYDVYGDINSWFEDVITSIDDLLSEFVSATYIKQVIYDGRGVVYDRRWLRDSTQIINNMKISSIDMTCPNPDMLHSVDVYLKDEKKTHHSLAAITSKNGLETSGIKIRLSGCDKRMVKVLTGRRL